MDSLAPVIPRFPQDSSSETSLLMALWRRTSSAVLSAVKISALAADLGATGVNRGEDSDWVEGGRFEAYAALSAPLPAVTR